MPNGEFHREDEIEWLRLDDKEEIIDFSFRRTEIPSGLSSKFYDTKEPDYPLKDRPSFVSIEKNVRLRFKSQPQPWLPPTVLDKLDKLRKGIIDRKEMTDLMNKIAEISINFYRLESERFVALRFDGRVVESADSEIELLLKIQGKKYGTPVFVWYVGHDAFSGWRT